MKSRKLTEKEIQDVARFLNRELNEDDSSALQALLITDLSFRGEIGSLAAIETSLSDALALNHSMSALPKEPPPWALPNLERCSLLLRDRIRSNPPTSSFLDSFKSFRLVAPAPAPEPCPNKTIPPSASSPASAATDSGEMEMPTDAKKIILMKLPIRVRDLAARLNIKPHQLMNELMEMSVLATINQILEEAVAKKICEKRGLFFSVDKRKESDE